MSDSFLFWGFGLLGIAALLFVVEVFIPSGGVIGIVAAVAALGGVIAFWQESWVWGVTSLGIVIVLTPICFNFALKVMPNTPVGRMLILGSAEETAQAQEEEEIARHEQERSLIGAEGRALTDLRPIGVAEIEGTRVDVLSEAGVIPRGSAVRVIDVQGTQIRVRRA